MRTRSRICSLVSASFGLWSGLSGPVDCIPVHVKNPKTDVFDEIHLLSQLVFILCFFFGNGGSRIAAVIYNCWDASEALALSWRHLFYCSQFRFFCFSRGDATLYSTGDAIRRERDGLTCSSSSNNESQPLQRCDTFSRSRLSPIRLPRTQRPAHARREKEEHTVRTSKREITE